MKRKIHIVTVAFFIGFLSLMGYITYSKEPLEYSELEYRELAQRPVFSFAALASGDFTKDFESYFQDQFYKRIEISKHSYLYQIAMGKPLVSTALIGEDGWAKGKPSNGIGETLIQQTLNETKKMSDFAAEHNIPLYLSINPHKDYVLNDIFQEHPNMKLILEAKETILNGLDEGIAVIDNSAYFRETFSLEQLKDMYYKTDHHWNYRGAYENYKHLVQQLNSKHPEIPEALEEEELTLLSANRDAVIFTGSTNRALLNVLDESEEAVSAYTVKDSSVFSEIYSINHRGQRIEGMDELFHTTLDQNEQTYGGLTTGDYPLMVLKMKEPPNNLKVLIIKDSYNNAMMPYLGLHFAETHIIDMRHYTDGSAKDYILENDINFVILSHNEQLTGDTFLYDGKES